MKCRAIWAFIRRTRLTIGFTDMLIDWKVYLSSNNIFICVLILGLLVLHVAKKENIKKT